MESLIAQLRARWFASNNKLTSGFSDEEIAAAEEFHGVTFPPDIREYLRLINGMPNNGLDEETICFWPLERIVPVAVEYSRWMSLQSSGDGPEMKPCFIFADYLISSQFLCVCVAPGIGWNISGDLAPRQ
ncbi:MAG: SMI1/KNR4 family protein [Candidatus Kapaibacterium sp.]